MKKRLLWAVLFSGLVMRAGYAMYAQNRGLIPTTSDGYETIALNLVNEGEYAYQPGRPTSHREPGYPLFIAGVYQLVGHRSPSALLTLQCLLSVFTAWLCFVIGRRLFDENVGLLAAAGYALYPQAVYYSGYYFRETLAAFLVTGLVWASTHWKDAGKKGDRAAFGAGLFAMAAGLTNSGLLPAAVFSAFALRGKRLGLYLLPVVLGCVVWTARNGIVQGRLVLGSTHGGEEFYQALIVPPDELGTSRQTEIVAADPVFRAVDGAEEGARNAALTRASLLWIAGHPGLYASRAAAGVVKFWRLWPYKRAYDHSYAALVAASLLGDGWLVPLGMFGLFAFRRRFRDAPAAWIAAIATTLLYGLVHAVIRYRVPLMPTVAVFAAAAAFRLFGTIRAPRKP